MPLSSRSPAKIVTSEELGVATGQLIPFTFTFERTYQVLYATNIYSADATVITRQPSCAIFTDTGQLAWNMVSSSVVIASQTEQVYWPQGELAQGFLFAVIPIRLASQLYVFRDYSIVFTSLSTGPGDLQAPFFMLREL